MNRVTTPLKAAFCFSLLLVSGLALYAQNRGIVVEAARDLGSSVGKQWAVFIAIDRYQEWNPLQNPVRDAKEIRDILNENYYIDEVRELYDREATAAGIRQLLINMRSQVGKDDSVFVFYAGHGYTDPYTNTGFWIPADGGRDQMAQVNWVPNIQVRNMLSQLSAKHVFLISDSCFSGDLLDTNRGAPSSIDSNYYKRAYSMVSRQVMTSGASESVPDTSEFALRLKSSLRRAEGTYIDPEYIFTIVREVRTTQPMLGVITGSEHQRGGSFLFFRKQGVAAVPAAAVTPQPAPAPAPAPSTPRPGTAPLPDTGTKAPQEEPDRRFAFGVTAGTSFSAPWFIGTVFGRIYPGFGSIDAGVDFGMGSGYSDIDYYSFYPFAHYNFTITKHWYIGVGGGYMLATYTFPDASITNNTYGVDACTGVTLGVFNISYSARTNFTSVNNKIALGFVF